MAEHWYRTLAGADVRADIVETLYEKDYGEWRKIMEDYLAWRRGE